MFQHGPDMVPKSRHSIAMILRPYLPSLENFRALVGLEVKLGKIWSKHGVNMDLTWPHKFNDTQKFAFDHVDSVLTILEL